MATTAYYLIVKNEVSSIIQADDTGTIGIPLSKDISLLNVKHVNSLSKSLKMSIPDVMAAFGITGFEKTQETDRWQSST